MRREQDFDEDYKMFIFQIVHVQIDATFVKDKRV